MFELFRLFLQTGESRAVAASMVLVAWATNSVPEAKHATMEYLLGVLPEDDEDDENPDG